MVLVICSYLFGSVSSAILITRLWSGKDIRLIGTHNAGGTNVAREVGIIPALLVGIFDVLKGMLPVIAARFLNLDGAWGLIGAIAATLGHSFPLYFNFRGGKGMACAIGALLALAPVETILYIPVFFSVFLALTGSAVTGGLVALPLLMGLLAWRGYATLIVFTPLILLIVMGICALPQAIIDYRSRPNKEGLVVFWLNPTNEKPDKNQPKLFTAPGDFAIGLIALFVLFVLLWYLLSQSDMTGLIMWVVTTIEAIFTALLILWIWKKVQAKNK